MIISITHSTRHGVRRVCEVLQVPRSSYYHAAKPTESHLKDAQLAVILSTIFSKHRRRYGYRRLWKQLSAEGHSCAPCRVRRLMREHNLKALQPKSYTPKTSDGRADAPSPNRILNQSLPTKPNQVWAGDITYIPMGHQWLYLAVVIDLCSRRIVGWALAEHLRSSLVEDALKQALASRQNTQGIIFHSDRGSQYGSKDFRKLLRSAQIQQSMSARANPYHNAWTESFMGTLKKELIQQGSFTNLHDAQCELFAFIDSYYNSQRLHSSLNYKTPSRFEADIALTH